MATQSLADRIAEACYRKYAGLPKSGKPGPGEWTLMSGVVQRNSNATLKVVALGTGSKCVGRNEMSRTGDVLNDSHAEVVARRAFLRYLYRRVEETREGASSDVFVNVVQGKCVLREDVSFHFYTSHTPCGDASIFPKTNDLVHFQDECRLVLSGNAEAQIVDAEVGTRNVEMPVQDVFKSEGKVICRTLLKRKCDISTLGSEKRVKSLQSIHDSDNDQELENKERCNDVSDTKVESISDEAARKEGQRGDIHRTGAKCVPAAMQDAHAPGVGYHVTSVLRTKPGRGDPTLSLSCSDKMARWNVMGCQGALLSLLISTPIFFASIVVGGGCPYSSTALRRALIDRVEPCLATAPSIVQSTLEFVDRRTASRRPCAASIAWCDVIDRPLEISVKGRKQGVTKKAFATPAGRLQICRRELGNRFLAVSGRTELADATYRQVKGLADDYRRRWRDIKEACMESWPTKPAGFMEFRIRE